MDRAFVRGKIVKGVGKASYFTALAWVQEQCREKLGFQPCPGTLNVELSPEDSRLVEEPQNETRELLSPDPAFCNARALPVSLGSLPGAIILPAADVKIHEATIVEIICPVNIKDTLCLGDGEWVTITLGAQKGT